LGTKLVVCGLVWGLARILGGQETTDSLSGTTERSTATSSSRATVARRITFEKRWKSLKDLYTQAGFDDQKITKLKDIDLAVLEDLDKGRQPDFKELQSKRRQIVSEDDETRLESARREQLRKRNSPDENKTETSQTVVQE
jgi:hypothetical protein